MSKVNGKSQKKHGIYTRAAGIGFLICAVIILSCVLFLRPEKPVEWPPYAGALSFAIYAAGGTIMMAGLLALVVLAVWVIGILAGRGTWGDLARKILSVIIVVSMTAAAMWVAIDVFYWPWAVASAVRTVHSNPEKWRLIACGELLADHWNKKVKRAMEEKPGSTLPQVRAAIAYCLAATGDKASLERLTLIAGKLPDKVPGGKNTTADAPPGRTRISGAADVLWLLEHLTDGEYSSLDDFRQRAGDNLNALTWDPREKRYVQREALE